MRINVSGASTDYTDYWPGASVRKFSAASEIKRYRGLAKKKICRGICLPPGTCLTHLGFDPRLRRKKKNALSTTSVIICTLTSQTSHRG